MAGAKCNHRNSAAVALSVGSWKGIISYTPPSGVAAEIPSPTISFTGTSSSGAKCRVRMVLGNTGQVGTALNPVAPGSNNPAGVSLGTGLENLTTIGSGGTVIDEQEFPPYGTFVFRLPPNLIVAPGVAIQLDANGGSAANIQVSFPGIGL